MVDEETGQTVPLSEASKAFQAEPGLFVTVSSEDIEKSPSEAEPEGDGESVRRPGSDRPSPLRLALLPGARRGVRD